VFKLKVSSKSAFAKLSEFIEALYPIPSGEALYQSQVEKPYINPKWKSPLLKVEALYPISVITFSGIIKSYPY
jgi:antibiotic biosynthesis monooxygenase (ABM) superfamily enzyme